MGCLESGLTPIQDTPGIAVKSISGSFLGSPVQITDLLGEEMVLFLKPLNFGVLCYIAITRTPTLHKGSAIKRPLD